MNKTFRFTMSPKDGLATERFLSAPNKLEYIRALIRREMQRSYGQKIVGTGIKSGAEATWCRGADFLEFETDPVHHGEHADFMVHFSNKDADIMEWIEEQDKKPTKLIHDLIMEDACGSDWQIQKREVKRIKEQIANAKKFTVHARFSAYNYGAKEAVEMLGVQTNMTGYVKNLIRRDIGMQELPLYTDHLNQRNFLRFDLFGNEDYMDRWLEVKEKEEDLKWKLKKIEDKMRQDYLTENEYNAVRKSVEEFQYLSKKLKDLPKDKEEERASIESQMQMIQAFQGSMLAKALNASPDWLVAEHAQVLAELTVLKQKIQKYNENLNKNDVKSACIQFELTDPVMVDWMKNKRFITQTKIPRYDYWCNMRRNFKDDKKKHGSSEYKRQLGESYGFYLTQLIRRDREQNGFSDRARQRKKA